MLIFIFVEVHPQRRNSTGNTHQCNLSQHDNLRFQRPSISFKCFYLILWVSIPRQETHRKALTRTTCSNMILRSGFLTSDHSISFKYFYLLLWVCNPRQKIHRETLNSSPASIRYTFVEVHPKRKNSTGNTHQYNLSQHDNWKWIPNQHPSISFKCFYFL